MITTKTYRAVVRNGTIRIETPDLADGTPVEIKVQESTAPNQTQTIFEQLEEIRLRGLPNDFSVMHKPKEQTE
ncbi:MAG: hypothetical protein SFU91_00780 [Chloroherpetonaceae bacterium]|nr:hypothetical protein [Chloroherpetonaceae bacterium]